MTTNTEGETCKHCGRDIAIRNPKGYCDHLRYPEACEVCSTHKNIEGEKFTDNYFMATSGKNDIRRKDIKKAIIQATELERKRIRDNITALSRYEASDVPKGNIVMLAGDIAQVIENCISCPACQTKYLK